MQRSIPDELTRRLGPDRVVTDEALRDQRRHDSWVLALLRALEGRPADMPLCVVQPQATAEVVSVIEVCRKTATPLVPFGLGSGVCGGVAASAHAVLLDMSAMRRIRAIDAHNLTGSFDAGTRGSDAEDAVAAHGLTIGHWPQSIALSSVGGWVATRSSGQMSTRYGNIEDMVLALEAVLPDGTVLDTRLAPRASSGPDLKHLLLGSEGTLGVITGVTLSLRRRPPAQALSCAHVPSMAHGLDALRAMVQEGWAPAVTRLYDQADAARLFPGYLRQGQGLLLLVHEGPAALVEAEAAACRALCAAGGCDPGPEEAVAHWLRERNHVPSFTELLKQGFIFDTIEVSALWDRLPGIYEEVLRALAGIDGLVLAAAHCSHCYRSGANLYFTFGARPSEPARRQQIYEQCWQLVMGAVLAGGGSICHHHGIGRVRRGWMGAELGASGIEVLRRLKQALDPKGFMNPGVLFPDP